MTRAIHGMFSGFRFWPGLFLEVDLLWELRPVHRGVHPAGGPDHLAIFRQYVLCGDHWVSSRVCGSHAWSSSVPQELHQQVDAWHEVRSRIERVDLNIRWPNYPEIYILDIILLECFERNFLRVEGLFNTQEKNIFNHSLYESFNQK